MAGLTIQKVSKKNDKYKKMEAVYHTCKNADVEIPEEVRRFFNYEGPDPLGDVEDMDIERAEDSSDMEDVYIVDLSTLKDSTHIVVTLSY